MPPASIAVLAAHSRRDEPSLVVRGALALLRAYKVLLSPLFAGACRFAPSCSDYMADALREHGLAAGAWLGLKRLARCHPFGGHGYDPVPPKRG
jgi:putative membrane protein insertion efficiency factor